MTEQSTALSTACTSNSISDATSILSTNPALMSEPLTWFDSDGKELTTPAIFIAIDYGHVELVKEMLVFFKDDVAVDSLKSGSGDYNSLGWASWVGNFDIVKLLVEEAGATVDDEALELSRESNNAKVTEFLLQHIDLYSGLENDPDAIMEKACREGDINKVRKLIEEDGYDLEKCSQVPMFMAVKFGRIDIVTLFKEKGVEIELDMGGDGMDKFKAMAEELNEEDDENSLAED